MRAYRHIWRHEALLADAIARELVADPNKGPRRFSLGRVVEFFGRRRNQRFIRKNLLFSKRLAFQAACSVRQGEQAGTALRLVEIHTREILDKDRRGLYTEKIRRRQLQEINLLLEHYLRLMATGLPSYNACLQAAYPSRSDYERFLAQLEKLESQVLNASKSTVRHGSRRQRANWFDRLRSVSSRIRRQEMARIYEP